MEVLMLRTKLAAVYFSLFAGSAFAAVPIINSSSSSTATITISGSNLSGGTASVVLGSYAPLAVTSQTATQLVATLPSGVGAGSYALSVQIGNSKTNSASSIATIGAIGPTGAAGPAGAQGPVGATGAIGPAGAQGAPGPQGAAGPQGVQGVVGPVGATGAQGAKGDAGATGAQGVAGPAGAAGAQGSKGDVGAPGPQGLQGPIGPPGGPALQLLDANNTVVGSVYGTPSSGSGLVLATLNGERVAIPYGFGNLSGTGQILGPEITLGTTGYLAFIAPGCTGNPYIINGWSYPGATRPSVVYQYGRNYAVYMPRSLGTGPQLITWASVLYAGPPNGPTGPMNPVCYASSGQGYGYIDPDMPISPSWLFPFSVQ
jgi:hypothetical protein